MQKIKRNDMVKVIAGKDKDKKGKILHLSSKGGRAIIEGINMVKKHKRRTQQDQTGGVVSTPMPMRLSNVLIICKNCNKPARVGFKILTDGSKTRMCKKCKEPL